MKIKTINIEELGNGRVLIEGKTSSDSYYCDIIKNDDLSRFVDDK